MKKNFRLSGSDENRGYRDEIEKMVDEILPLVEDFYRQFDVIVKEVTYDSTKEFGRKTIIKFDVESKGLYPDFKIEVSMLGSAFLSPKERRFNGVFILKGIASTFSDYLYTEKGVSPIISVYDVDDRRSVVNKLTRIFNDAKEKLDEWNSYRIANDIFLF